jgi:phospholipase/carboxylesterase
VLEYNITKYDTKINRIVIMFHGYGSNKEDLINLAPEIHSYCKNIAYVSLSAPCKFELAPESKGRQWFSLLSREPEYLLEGMNKISIDIRNFIKKILEKFGLNEDSLCILGFSQGAMLSLYLLLTKLISPRIVVAFSGWIFPHNWKLTKKRKTSTLLLHGEEDEIICVSTVAVSMKILEDHGYKVDKNLSRALGHGIDRESIERAGIFIRNNFR